MENTKYFEDTVLREHLLTCLCNIQLTKSQLAAHNEQKIKSRDVRQSLYYKIGVKQSVSNKYHIFKTNFTRYYIILFLNRDHLLMIL